MALFAGAAAAQIKYVAVVETGVDEASGASAEITPAEVRLVTNGLRREAVKNLPPEKYNIMTSETVYAQGGAVLEECAEENCVIVLGSKIGADYIVRGIISKFGTELTLSIEMYETEDGTLVGAFRVSSENPKGLLEKAVAGCAEMYKKFEGAQSSAPKATAVSVAPPPAGSGLICG